MENQDKDPKISIKTVDAYPNGYPKAEVICVNCKQLFDTFHPKLSGTCSCGNIECDVNTDYIRVLDLKKLGYRYQENGKTINGVELNWSICY